MNLRINQAKLIVFVMVDDSDVEVSGLGDAFDVLISKNGAAFVAGTGAKAEIGDGWYSYNLNAEEIDTVGPLAVAITAEGAAQQNLLYQVVGSGPQEYTPSTPGAMLVADLVEKLTEDVPPRGGVPSEGQYERMVKEAVRDFGRRAGRVKRATIAVTAGTATYDLPADFLKMITLFGLVANDGIINTPEGLIPISAGFREKYTIAAREITFYPTPTYTLTRYISYKAGWVISGDDDYTEAYEEMTEEEAEIILLKAKSLALELQANLTASDGWRYQIGDEMVDKSGQQTAYKVRMDAAESEYLKAVETYNGNTGMAG